MAATATSTTQLPHSSKPKRRKRRETTISTSATTPDLPLHPTIVSSQNTSWCCSSASPPQPLASNSTNIATNTTISSKPIVVINNTTTTHSTHSAHSAHSAPQDPNPSFFYPSPSSPSPTHSIKFNFSPGRVSPIMDSPRSPSTLSTTTSLGVGVASSATGYGAYPTSYSKFNSALNAGLLNPLSPPPAPRCSPTLFEMMANEVDCNSRAQIPNGGFISNGKPPVQDKQLLLHQRLAEMLGNCSPGNKFNDPESSDVKLTLSSKDGLSVTMNVHRQILVGNSRFFAEKLSDKWSRQQRSLPHVVEISDCEDVEVYVETLRLMYCRNLRRKLMKEDVSKVLGILKVSAAIMFEAGVLSCLEYLEAVPWAEDEEEKVSVLLSQLHLPGNGAGEVLKRVSAEIMAEPEEGSNNEEVLVKLLQVVLEGKDEKARRNMKGLVLKMLRESSSQNDLSKDSLCSACDQCLQLLRTHFLRAAETPSDVNDGHQIARQADNLHWLLDIMIDRQVADDFLKTWAEQSELSEAHHKVPVIHRYEVSRVTARLFVGIGKGQLLASKEVRCLLLQTWLKPFYDDFGWMRRASNGLDRHSVEDGLSNTILTLPLAWQQEILLAWFDRFLNSGDDCPNIQRGFQVWWRRAFWRRYGESEQRPL